MHFRKYNKHIYIFSILNIDVSGLNILRDVKYMAKKPTVLSCNFFNGDVSLNCNENPIYAFPEQELRGLSPTF